MNQRLYLLIGIPASGKSSWAQKLLDKAPDSISYISSDKIRETVFGDVSDMNHNAAVFQIMKDRMVAALKRGHSVILDATFVKAAERRPYIKLAQKHGVQVEAYYINTNLELALGRNANRSRQVPPDVIKQRFEELQEPTYDEGFTHIVTIGSGADI